MRKSILKRFKFTKTGKILRRKVGTCHNRAKKPEKKIRQLRRYLPLTKSEEKLIKRYLH